MTSSNFVSAEKIKLPPIFVRGDLMTGFNVCGGIQKCIHKM